jgi:hypothetical protein
MVAALIERQSRSLPSGAAARAPIAAAGGDSGVPRAGAPNASTGTRLVPATKRRRFMSGGPVNGYAR